MNDMVYTLARKLRPELETMAGQQRMSATADVLTLLYTLPMAVIGVVWLVRLSSWELFIDHWRIYLLMAVIFYLFNRLRFFFITEIRTGGYANSDGAMDGIAVWAAVLLLGPIALWIKVFWDLVTIISSISREYTRQSYWSRGRMISADVATDTLPTLVALTVYQAVGGAIPISDFSIRSIAPAFLAVVIQYVGAYVVYAGYIAYILVSLKNVLHTSTRPAVSFFFMALTLPALANPFGILAAGIYSMEGLWEFLFIMLGLLLVAVLARRLSGAAENSRQQSNQLEQLEMLGRDILDAPPDASMLPELLQKHVSTMFAMRGVLIWTEPKGILLQEPVVTSYDQELSWKWLRMKNEAYFSMPGTNPPWNPDVSFPGPIILCPIKDVDNGQPIGEIFLELQTMMIWNPSTVRRQLPAVQSLAAQIASALNQAKIYAANIAIQKTLQELSIARSIQTSFLPASIPQLPGWQLAAALEPARQIAGDFYDFISLPDGRLGILIADVADKGLGSAMYMALSSTLIRTFANEYHRDPAQVLKTANQHILHNARANLFVTVFFAVLDPSTGTLRYANAGHNPPFLLGNNHGIKTLNNTGMPLGIDEENTWGQDEVSISPGEILVLYTDGVTDAQNKAGEFIDKKIILTTIQQNFDKSVQDIQQEILNKIHSFVGDAPRFDDLTLVILGREAE